MYCQDSVLKENWSVERGELYIIGPEGSTPRRAEIEISLVLWPEKQQETTKRFLVVPITYDLQTRDPRTDLIFRVRNTGRSYAVMLDQAHVVANYRLLKYVGQVSDKVTTKVSTELKRLFLQCCGPDGSHPSE